MKIILSSSMGFSTSMHKRLRYNLIMELLKHLKQNGYRITESRKMICEVLEKNVHFHFSVNELYKLINSESRSIVDKTTIYRTLDALEELGLLTHSHVPHKSAIYFINDKNQNVHLICEKCDKIIDLPNNSINSINSILKNETHFESINNNYVFVGTCIKCK